jgi:glucokinase
MIFAGDVGGTGCRFGLFDVREDRPHPVAVEKYPSRDHARLEDIVAKFLAAHPGTVEAACFGIAGPVMGGEVVTPNLPWHIRATSLAKELGLGHVALINDLEANAYGATALPEPDFECLQQGEPDPHGNAGIISAGTGLGQAGFYFDGARLRPFASEGGHVDFAPQCDLEIELLRFLRGKFGHVSYERVLSGPGLVNIFEFLRATGRGVEPTELTAELASGMSAGVIAAAGLAGTSSRAGQALDLFVTLYGAEAGNLALKMKATRGVLIGGGIAPKLIRKLREPRFLAAFLDKGRMLPLLKRIPVRVILNDQCALLGAALYGALEVGKLRNPGVG